MMRINRWDTHMIEGVECRVTYLGGKRWVSWQDAAEAICRQKVPVTEARSRRIVEALDRRGTWRTCTIVPDSELFALYQRAAKMGRIEFDSDRKPSSV